MMATLLKRLNEVIAMYKIFTNRKDFYYDRNTDRNYEEP